MKIDGAVLFTGVVCSLLAIISSYFVVTHDIKSSVVFGVILGIVVYATSIEKDDE